MKKFTMFIIAILIIGSVRGLSSDFGQGDIRADAYSSGLADGGVYSGDVLIAFTYAYPVAIEIYIDMLLIKTIADTTSASYILKTAYWENGEHNVTFSAYPDGDTSARDNEEFVVIFENAVYTPIMAMNLTEGQLIDGSVVLDVTSLEGGSINVYVDNQYLEFFNIASQYYYVLDTTGWADGNHTVKLILGTAIGQFELSVSVIFNNQHFSTDVYDGVVMHDYFRINAYYDVDSSVDMYVDGKFDVTWEMIFWNGKYSFAEELDTAKYSSGNHMVGFMVHPSSGGSSFYVEYNVVFEKGMTVSLLDGDMYEGQITITTTWDRGYNYNFYVDGNFLGNYPAVDTGGLFETSLVLDTGNYPDGWRNIEFTTVGPGFEQYSVKLKVFFNNLHFSTSIGQGIVMHDHFRVSAELDVDSSVEVYVDGQYLLTWYMIPWNAKFSFAEELDTTAYPTGQHMIWLKVFPAGYGSYQLEYDVTFAKGMDTNLSEDKIYEGEVEVVTTWDRQYQYNLYVDGSYIYYTTGVDDGSGSFETTFAVNTTELSYGWHEIEFAVTGSGFSQYSVITNIFVSNLHFKTNIYDQAVLYGLTDLSLSLDVEGSVDVIVDNTFMFNVVLNPWNGGFSAVASLDTLGMTGGYHVVSLAVLPNGLLGFSLDYNVSVGTPLDIQLDNPDGLAGAALITLMWEKTATVNFYVNNEYVDYVTLSGSPSTEYSASLTFDTTGYADGDYTLRFIVAGFGGVQYSLYLNVIITNTLTTTTGSTTTTSSTGTSSSSSSSTASSSSTTSSDPTGTEETSSDPVNGTSTTTPSLDLPVMTFMVAVTSVFVTNFFSRRKNS